MLINVYFNYMVKHFKWYPGEDEKKNFKRKSKQAKPASLRKGLKPGTIVILLAGRFRGRRAVFLKQLKSGLALVTGPYKVNGIPLKRVSQAYIIPTSTQLEIPSVAESINDEYFKKAKEAPKEKKFLKEEKEHKLPAEKKEIQKNVDKDILSKLDKKSMQFKYLQARFTLRSGMRPHEMKF
jgi:large subunit ribosomal protein L6e